MERLVKILKKYLIKFEDHKKLFISSIMILVHSNLVLINPFRLKIPQTAIEASMKIFANPSTTYLWQRNLVILYKMRSFIIFRFWIMVPQFLHLITIYGVYIIPYYQYQSRISRAVLKFQIHRQKYVLRIAVSSNGRIIAFKLSVKYCVSSWLS